MLPRDGRQRVQIERVSPEIDGGRFPIKRTIGEKIHVEADMFCDGHDMITGIILYRPETSQQWQEAPLSPLVNDRWQGEFTVSEMGSYVYTVMAWVDHFQSWRRDIQKKIDALQVAPVDWLIGAQLIEEASQRTSGQDAEQLQTWSNALRSHANASNGILEDKIVSPQLTLLMGKYPDRQLASTYEKLLKVTVDREKARFSTWYELFPRSCGAPENMVPSPTVSPVSPILQIWALMSSTYRPFTRLALPFAKGKTTPLSPNREMWECLGALVPQKEGTKRFTPNLGPPKTSEI
jgi:starch synthase (maltosyl-transferring)